MRYIIDVDWPKDYAEWASAKEVEHAIQRMLLHEHGFWPLPEVRVELDPEMER